MKVTIFGANGRTGRPLVQQALQAGHEVTAFVRDPQKFEIAHDHLHKVKGDITDAQAVAGAIAGADAVISVIGPAPGTPETLMRTASANIVNGMKAAGVKRLIYMSGAGVKDPKDPPSFLGTMIVTVMKLTQGAMLADSEAGVRFVQASDLDWTIVRGPRLGDDPAKGNYITGYIQAGATPVSRADVADFILKEVVKREYVRESPIIYYG
jgi:putative NADH-flavin reductase